MAASWDKEAQEEQEDQRVTQANRSKMKIEVESSEDMEINQDEGYVRETFEIGQSSRNVKRGRTGGRGRGHR